jgi:hypothetical protein
MLVIIIEINFFFFTKETKHSNNLPLSLDGSLSSEMNSTILGHYVIWAKAE